MSVAGYEKVKTKVIEGKKKCIYKKHKGTKLYVKGFGKMRSVESYVKLCKKAAASKASKPKKSKKTRSKSAKKYGGFLQEFFANMDNENFSEKAEKTKDKFSTQPVNSMDVPKSHQEAPPSTPPPPPTPPSKTEGFNAHDQKIGGSSCSKKGGYRGGNNAMDYFQVHKHGEKFLNEPDQSGGRRRKRNKVPKSMLDKLMMAATFRKRSVKKGKKYHRKGGNLLNNFGLMGGQSQTDY